MGGLCPGGGGGAQYKAGKQPRVELDLNYMGSDCVLVKNGLRICGECKHVSSRAGIHQPPRLRGKLDGQRRKREAVVGKINGGCRYR